jgi:large subunit ribosomal protein L18e
MVKSKTKIEKQSQRKRNFELVETIRGAKKAKAWIKVADILSRPRRKSISLNLSDINKEAKAGDIIVVPGKILSQGELDKKIKLVALAFSEKAREKLTKSKSEHLFLSEEIKKNPSAKGIKILEK